MNSPYPETMTKEEVIDWIRKGREEYNAVWQGLSEEEMTRRPGPQADWSVKDQIAHLSWWETFTIARVTLVVAGHDMPMFENFDAINAQVFAEHKDLTLAQVLAYFHDNLARIEGLVYSMTNEQLNDSTNYKSRGHSPLRLIGGNTFGHYAEHQPDLERYVASLKA